MKKFLSLALILSLALSLAPAVMAEETFAGIGVVDTQYGKVSGVPGTQYDVTVFKGIPYAAPPVGDLRWKEPQDAESWEGVRVCDTYAAAAYQPNYAKFMMKPGAEFYPDGFPTESEDCLYLNVVTPAASADEKLPVMVWFHGGGLAHGFSYQAPFQGEDLANKGVILVTVGHRLNALGFLALPQLSAESEYGGSGNYGVMDGIKAVEWVYNNIAGFGGDPENIMVFGQSGGSAKTAAIAAAPQTQGQIAKIAEQSAFSLLNRATMGYASLEEAEEMGLQLLDEIGVSHDATLEELRAIPAETLSKSNIAAGLGMNLDGKYIVESRQDFYLGEGNMNHIDVLAGYVYGENIDSSVGGDFAAATAEELYAKLRDMYGEELYNKYDIGNALTITDANVAWYNVYLAHCDRMALLRLYAEAAKAASPETNTYLYSFDRVTPNKDFGWHSGELWYVFGGFNAEDETQPKWGRYDHMVLDTTTTYWTNFAKTGDPNGNGAAEWPEATGEGMPYQYIDVISSTNDDVTAFDQMVLDFYAAQLDINN